MHVVHDIYRQVYAWERKPFIGALASVAIAVDNSVRQIYHIAMGLIFGLGSLCNRNLAQTCYSHTFQAGQVFSSLFQRILNIATLGFLFHLRNPSVPCYYITS